MFINSLFKNMKTVFRLLRSIILRPFNLIRSRLSNLFNATIISRFVTKIQKAFSDFIKSLKLKPTRREDYLDVGTVYVAKSLLLVLLILIAGIGLLFYFLIWPWFSSTFLTTKFYDGQKQLSSYTGKVIVYYDKKFDSKMYQGRVNKGKYTGAGQLYYKDGVLEYSGSFSGGKYEGTGTSYSEKGAVVYTGGFKAGAYSGTGSLNRDDGTVYQGEFSDGAENGKGLIYKNKIVIYGGSMKDGQRAGDGRAYFDSGKLEYTGAFAQDVFEGDGTRYYNDGRTVEYKGAFSGGVFSGKGVMYNKDSVKIYEGDFQNGKYDGDGRLYNNDGSPLYTGAFADGLFDGSGKLIISANSSWYDGDFMAGKKSGSGKLYKNNQLYYDGSFADDMMSGQGKLTDIDTGFEYDGLFDSNDIAFGSLFGQQAAKISAMFVSGMTQNTSAADAYYLYNSAYGILLKLSYASGTAPAALTAAYTLPVNSPLTKITKKSDIRLAGSYRLGETTKAAPDAQAAKFLSLNSAEMNCYSLLYDGYTVCYYTDEATGAVKLIKYLPAAKTAVTQTSAAQTDAAQAAAFQNLGLDMSDFKSLGF